MFVLLRNRKRDKVGKEARSQLSVWQRAFKKEAPRVFSIVTNTDAMNRFLKELLILRKQHPVVGIDASKIEHFSPDAVTVMLAFLDANQVNRKSRLTAKLPLDSELRAQWLNTSFERYARDEETTSYHEDFNSIECVDKKATRNITKATLSAIARIVGHDIALGSLEQKASTIIVEALKDLVMNVYQHAGEPRGSCKWWLSVLPNIETGTISFCLVDAGVGVLKSEHVKRWKSLNASSIMSGVRLAILSDCEILQMAINGEILFTETKQSHRGQGLRSVKELVSENFATSMFVITNSVRGDVISGKFEPVSNETQGTVYVFETRSRFWST